MIESSWIIIAIVVGLVVALIVTGIMRASLKSVAFQHSAKFYENEEGLHLTRSQDIFMYKRTDRTAKPKEQPRQQGR